MIENISDISYWTTRFLFQRSLGFCYLIAFSIIVLQFRSLCGKQGLLPIQALIRRFSFIKNPTLFYLNQSDFFIAALGWVGVGLSVLALSGFSEFYGNAFSIFVWLSLWLIYLSFVNVGQIFYGYGWESLLLETGFLSIFLGSYYSRPSEILIWLFRWLLFRLMFGAGLIKLRGDPCWRNLTCMKYHYETQPLPHPLSWGFHHLPEWINKAGILFTHFAELIVPFGYLCPIPIIRYISGILTIIFQFSLISSGNLSWFNYLTIFISLSCFDDAFFSFFLPYHFKPLTDGTSLSPFVYNSLGIFVCILSIRPILNLFSKHQTMNESFNRFHFVNTYGAFGSIVRKRIEVIIKGTEDLSITSQTIWKEYEFKAKPGIVSTRPPFISPYHHKLDWQMWFIPLSPQSNEIWFQRFLTKILEGTPETIDLLRHNPFAEKPPQTIKVEVYEYSFSNFDEIKKGKWWNRKFLGNYISSYSLGEPFIPNESYFQL